MSLMPNFKAREQALAFELARALIDSWSFSQLFESTEKGLEKLFQADHVALCLMNSELPTGFEWKARETGLFLRDYHRWFQSDFVFRGLSLEPGTALSDTQLLKGQKLEDTETYRLSREAHLRLRHVLSVLLAPEGQQGRGAVALYSDRIKPFPEDRRCILQWFTPFLQSGFQSVMRFSSLDRHNQLLESLSAQASPVLVLTDASREKRRSASVTPLLEKWFSRSDLNSLGIPTEWVERVAELVRTENNPVPGRDTWSRHRPNEDLKVTFTRLPSLQEGRFWEVRMEEVMLLPMKWRCLLTPREIEVASCLLREGCSDEELARLLKGDREEFSVKTVKKHLQTIYKKVGADGRADFITRSLRP